MKFLEIALQREPGIVRTQAKMCKAMIGEQCFGSHFADREAGIAAYEARAIEVRAYVAPERLLEYELGSGWEPICEFLGVPMPASPFPRTNDRKEFFDNFDVDGVA